MLGSCQHELVSIIGTFDTMSQLGPGKLGSKWQRAGDAPRKRSICGPNQTLIVSWPVRINLVFTGRNNYKKARRKRVLSKRGFPLSHVNGSPKRSEAGGPFEVPGNLRCVLTLLHPVIRQVAVNSKSKKPTAKTLATTFAFCCTAQQINVCSQLSLPGDLVTKKSYCSIF